MLERRNAKRIATVRNHILLLLLLATQSIKMALFFSLIDNLSAYLSRYLWEPVTQLSNSCIFLTATIKIAWLTVDVLWYDLISKIKRNIWNSDAGAGVICTAACVIRWLSNNVTSYGRRRRRRLCVFIVCYVCIVLSKKIKDCNDR